MLNSISDQDQQFLEGNELLKERRYLEAENLFIKVLSDSPNHLDANSAMADLYFRKGKYKEGLNAITKILSIDSYDAKANFLAGNIYRALGKYNDAKEAFGWASRSSEYRSAALAQMAEIHLINNKWSVSNDKSVNYIAKFIKN